MLLLADSDDADMRPEVSQTTAAVRTRSHACYNAICSERHVTDRRTDSGDDECSRRREHVLVRVHHCSDSSHDMQLTGLVVTVKLKFHASSFSLVASS